MSVKVFRGFGSIRQSVTDRSFQLRFDGSGEVPASVMNHQRTVERDKL